MWNLKKTVDLKLRSAISEAEKWVLGGGAACERAGREAREASGSLRRTLGARQLARKVEKQEELTEKASLRFIEPKNEENKRKTA